MCSQLLEGLWFLTGLISLKIKYFLKKSERIYSQLIYDQNKEMQSTFLDKLSFTKSRRSYSPKPL